MKKLLNTEDGFVKEIFNQFKKYNNSYGEPQAFIDISKYDDADITMVSVRITEEREGLSEDQYHYKAEIVITQDNDDFVDDDNVLCSESVGEDIIRELVKNLCSFEVSYLAA